MLSADQDAFFADNSLLNYGDLAENVKGLLDAFQVRPGGPRDEAPTGSVRRLPLPRLKPPPHPAQSVDASSTRSGSTARSSSYLCSACRFTRNPPKPVYVGLRVHLTRGTHPARAMSVLEPTPLSNVVHLGFTVARG